MKKKFFILTVLVSILISIFIIMLINKTRMIDLGEKQKEAGSQEYFNASILEMEENIVYVQPFEEEKELEYGERWFFDMDEMIAVEFIPQLNVGDTIRIVYNGLAEKGKQIRIQTVFAVYLLDTGLNVIY